VADDEARLLAIHRADAEYHASLHSAFTEAGKFFRRALRSTVEPVAKRSYVRRKDRPVSKQVTRVKQDREADKLARRRAKADRKNAKKRAKRAAAREAKLLEVRQ
jgi:hypothetical protein